MNASQYPRADRVETFVSAIDRFEPTILADHADNFRVLARFVSRSLDARSLERHPPDEMLPDIEWLMQTVLHRQSDEIIVALRHEDARKSGMRRTVLMTCVPDQLFLYSIVRVGLERLGLKTYRSVNTVVPIGRNAAGEINAVGGSDATRESLIFIEVEGEELQDRAHAIEAYLHGRLLASRAVVQDFSAIKDTIATLATNLDKTVQLLPDHAATLIDRARLLRWLSDEHFVFMGLRYLPEKGGQAALYPNLGIGRFDDWRGLQIEAAELDLCTEEVTPPFVWLRKSRTESWMYRPGRTDHVLVQCFDEQGKAHGLMVIEGLFSYPALAEPRTQVPLLDRTVAELYARLKATKGSHRYRTIRNAFNSLPLEYLFTLPQADVHKLVQQILEVDAEHRLQVHISCDVAQNIAFVFVALPRSHFSDELRSDIRRLLKQRFGASSVDDGVYAGDFESVTFHYFLTGMTALTEADEASLVADLEQLASPWVERLGDELARVMDKVVARRLHQTYVEAFSHRYREETSVSRALLDICLLEQLGPQHRFDCDVYQEKGDEALGVTRLRMFQVDSLLLSDILPVLDNFGLTVIDQFPTTVHLPSGEDRLINTFRISGVQGMTCELHTRRSRLRNAIGAVMRGAMSNDPLNRLMLRADIAWPSVVLMLAYVSYARQVGLPYGQATVQEALLTHSDTVRALSEMFRAKFDPAIEGSANIQVDERRLQLLERSRRTVLLMLDRVDDLSSDQILRTLYNLTEATVRTNFYARDLSHQFHLVLKFDPSLVTRMPDPRPYREIFVFHPEVAGLHLRGGAIARGGIRWSDRLLDFRTEVFGLASTQNLKNVLIVPRGAKGAFVLRNPPADLQLRRQRADELYKIFIMGLLDVTDNMVDAKPTPQPNVIAYDEPDPYLVVAADKGTAHLSDTANALAQSRNFWLGDAFASGGSKGYDHKREAITSRGAWACVCRHFRELGIDPHKDPIKTVGIGDMSGDVFGNGMLRSESLALVAAFDHRHIFIDPTPDAAQSFAARKALFERPRSSWEDYPKEMMSPGAGVWPRGAKTIVLSPEVQALLDVTQPQMSGPELVQAVLRAPVDLLWNGGIGTYIKAPSETHLEVGDPANDTVRIDAPEVRAKVIGEGGNLGITSAGRVDMAGQGIRLNTDAVDNSAGVDMSDHEVNLKILFAHRNMGDNKLTAQQRDHWMDTLREEVGERVVQNNWLQSRMLSLEEIRSRRDSARFVRSIAFLGERVPFKRRESNLPGERIMRLRQQKGEGLYRPELAVVAANAKLDLRQELARAADAFPLDSLREHLIAYFPDALHQDFLADIVEHPLGIDIARMMLTNKVIGDAGASWLPETSLMSGRNTVDILNAYFAASALIDARTLKAQADTLEPRIEAALEYRLRLRIEDALEVVCTWLLRRSEPVDTDFYRTLPQTLIELGSLIELNDELEAALMSHTGPNELTRIIGALSRIDDVLDVALLASQSKQPVEQAARAYFLVAQRTGVAPLAAANMGVQSGDDLDKPARFALRSTIRQHLLALSAQLLNKCPDPTQPDPMSAAWMDSVRRELTPLADGECPLSHLVMAAERLARRRAAGA